VTIARVPGAGLSTAAGHDVFPAGARDDVLAVTPWEAAMHLERVETREGGASRESWQPTQDSPVDARIDAIGTRGIQHMYGAIMHEDTSHIVTFRDPRPISAADRINIAGYDWIITGVKRTTSEPVTQVEVQQA
jgi:hypothetical protein